MVYQYKDASENRREIRKCFYRLITGERFDLLHKYADTVAALGLMDDELRCLQEQRKQLDAYRTAHLAALIDSRWADTLKIVSPSNKKDKDSEDDGEESEDETWEPEYDSEDDFENSIDQVAFPDGMTDEAIDAEIGIMYGVLRNEIQDSVFNPTVIAEEIRELQMATLQEADATQDYRANYNASISEAYDERIDNGEENADSGDTESASVLQFKRIGYPVREKQPTDPVIQAYQNLGASIVYRAAEDYIETLRMLWNGDSGTYECRRLIVRKWELETFMGSARYSLYTNINPERIMDQCMRTAMEREKAKLERINRRIAAGIESGEGT